jgi:phosphatidate cytidylyltransferase
MLWKRWITALAILPLLIALILAGHQTAFGLVLSAATVIALWEFFRIAFSGHTPPVPRLFSLWSYAAGIALVLLAGSHGAPAVAAVMAVHALGAAFFSLFRFSISQDAPAIAVKQIFALVYIPLFMACIAWLYDGGSQEGIHWVFVLLLIVIGGDTGAYFTGKSLGRHKLCPAVSPKKTVEGAIGGLLCSVVLAILYKLIFLPGYTVAEMVLLASLTGMIGQAGDLFESEFKRVAGVKDSGGLLPGHGGMLDRIDALLFAAPAAYLIKEFILI